MRELMDMLCLFERHQGQDTALAAPIPLIYSRRERAGRPLRARNKPSSQTP